MTATTSSVTWHGSAVRSPFRLGRVTSSGADWAIDWVLARNCSLAPQQLLGFYLSLCVLSLGIALMFWWQGARMVLPFALAELMGVGVALWFYARHATDKECIALTGDRFTVEHAHGLHVDRVEFQPAWVRIEPEQGDRSLIEVSGQGRRIAVGRFVRPEQRRQLAEELRFALRRWRQGDGQPATP